MNEPRHPECIANDVHVQSLTRQTLDQEARMRELERTVERNGMTIQVVRWLALTIWGGATSVVLIFLKSSLTGG